MMAMPVMAIFMYVEFLKPDLPISFANQSPWVTRTPLYRKWSLHACSQHTFINYYV